MAFNQIDFDDITYSIVTASIRTTIEQSFGITCACLSATRSLFPRSLSNIKNSSGHETNLEQAAHSIAIPLSQYASRNIVDVSTPMANGGFSRLSEEDPAEVGSFTARASKAENDDLPIVTQGIVRQQGLEQQTEDRSWS